MSIEVWKEVVKLQRNFLWGGLYLKRKISWVKWADICKPKLEGGLGIHNLRLINLSLLAKWRWKLLMDGDEMWKRITVAEYGEHALGSTMLEANWGGGCIFVPLGRRTYVGWTRVLGGWKDIWVGDVSLEQRYSKLFNISVQHDAMIRDIGRWDGGVWRWESCFGEGDSLLGSNLYFVSWKM
ncbi:hypothetical protein P8452_58969 [Trifolium repens]|nr:hypothetical protein P8452_58969 [Trifolium repens]